MKTIRYIFLTLAAATFVAACSEELNPNEINKANPGDEVQFGLSLPGKTKTVYGEETSTGFPIYWVNGDKVKVASPQCQSGRNNAEYSVSVESTTQNYATGLTKTGDYGVQWGDAKTADFYSIYPSTAGTTLNINGETVTAKLHVDATQFANTTSKKDVNDNDYFYSQPAEMGNVVMYAKTTVNRNDENTNGVVELHYTPFSTVLEFTLIAKSNGGNEEPLIIQSITLTAPTGTTIAGDFAFNFPTEDVQTPSIEAVTGGSNAITMHFLQDNQYNISLTPTKNTMKAKMCLMPISGVYSLVDWKVEVNTSAGTFIKTLKEADFVNKDGSPKNTALVAGKVHKITLPKLGFVSDEWVYDPGDWIPSLPDYRNIYLSELSLPGAWYAGGKVYTGSTAYQNYQTTAEITPLWDAGIRAFAVECRSWTADKTIIFDNNYSPTALCVSGTGYENHGAYCDGNTSSQKATKIRDIIAKIASCINNKADEYGVLVLSYADGGNGGHRDLDHSYFIQGVMNEIAQSGATNIYTEVITPETTVEQVKGKLIVVVNVDDNITKGSYANNGNMLINYTPFPSKLASKKEVYFSNLYWKKWEDTYKSLVGKNTSNLLWCFSSANRTDCTKTTSEDGTITNTNGVVTLSQRKAALKAMGDNSKTIYDASSHNVWFYFNCGGGHTTTTEGDTDAARFAKAMNPWLLNRIRVKSGEIKNSNGEYVSDPSPLGIVMFNRCTDSDTASYKGPAIIDAIIRMNSKFYLKHAGTSGGNTGGSTGGSEDNTSQNDSSFEDGGEMF